MKELWKLGSRSQDERLYYYEYVSTNNTLMGCGGLTLETH